MEYKLKTVAFQAPEDVKKQLQASARLNNRSLGKQVLHYVMQGLQIEAARRVSVAENNQRQKGEGVRE